jgi:hypothetical protein
MAQIYVLRTSNNHGGSFIYKYKITVLYRGFNRKFFELKRKEKTKWKLENFLQKKK